jgi:hypothetical protein
MKENLYDVIVVGAGTAGVVAALQASRAGAKTLLIEKYGIPGGTITMAGINGIGVFFACGKQIIAGIGWELVVKTLAVEGKQPPSLEKIPHLPLQNSIRVNSALYAMICDQQLNLANIDTLYHAMPAEVRREENGWTLLICTKTGLSQYQGKVLIDCTGDANLVQIAGYKVISQPVLQPATYTFHLKGYDLKTLNEEKLRIAYQNAINNNLFRDEEFGWAGKELGDRLIRLLRNHGNNAIHLCGFNASDSKGKTNLDIAGRNLILKIFRWLQSQPGFEHIEISSIATECGVRESPTIEGKKYITVEDYEQGKLWPDALCYSFYPIDLHTCEGNGLIYRPLDHGILPTIPRGAMLPKKSSFLIAAGRHISGDREANSAFRVTASCMAMGQAAGAMAALSAKTGKDPEELSLDSIKTLLAEHNAIIPKKKF